MSRYRPYAAAYAALHNRRVAAAGPLLIPESLVLEWIALRCADGKHRTESDSETGDEVCRYCGTTVEEM